MQLCRGSQKCQKSSSDAAYSLHNMLHNYCSRSYAGRRKAASLLDLLFFANQEEVMQEV